MYIPRTGQINARDNPPWVKAIEATNRKTLWNRPDAMEFATVMVDHIVPPYRRGRGEAVGRRQ